VVSWRGKVAPDLKGHRDSTLAMGLATRACGKENPDGGLLLFIRASSEPSKHGSLAAAELMRLDSTEPSFPFLV